MRPPSLAWLAGPLAVLGLSALGPGSASGAVCDLYADKTARPSIVTLGEDVEVTLTLDGRCPPTSSGAGADIVLAIDRSASQRDNGTWEPTKRAAGAFLDRIDFAANKVALLTFSGGLPIIAPEVEFHQRLTHDGEAARAALDAIPPPPSFTYATNITAAIDAAQAELESPRHRAGSTPTLVLLSDGAHNAPGTEAPLTAADRAKDAGTTIVAIGLAVDASAADTLRGIASRPELYFAAPTGNDLEAVLSEVAGRIEPGRLTSLLVTDMLPPEVELVAGSVAPPPTSYRDNTLQWAIPALEAAGWTARYRVRPLALGTYGTNKLAFVDFTDADGSLASRTFPLPVVTVVAPEPTPAPQRHVAVLPSLMRGHCRAPRPTDVVLAIDTSSSMWGEKLTRARDAGRELAVLLQMPPSQIAVVAFNASATVVQPLTADRADILAALDRLPREEGSRLDLALRAATSELASARRAPGHVAAVVLVTDGRQVGAPEQFVLDAAAAARAAGIAVFTIGIGADVDRDLLTLVADSPDHAFAAPTAADLSRIYRAIAGELPCVGSP